MVFAAPLFLISQTKSMRGFYLANKQAFINVGFGVSITYLALGLLAKMVRPHAWQHAHGSMCTSRGRRGCFYFSSLYSSALLDEPVGRIVGLRTTNRRSLSSRRISVIATRVNSLHHTVGRVISLYLLKRCYINGPASTPTPLRASIVWHILTVLGNRRTRWTS